MGCSKGRTVEFSEIRQAPDLGAIESYLEQTTFRASRNPNVYLIFFDTMRPDYSVEKNGPLKTFYDANLTFSASYATGTATWYSMFSFFHSMPGFLTYDLFPKVQSNTSHYGSIFLKVLNKLGYQVNTYGYDWRCDVEERPSGSSWKRLVLSAFGWKSRLLERCQTDPSYDSVFAGNLDEVTVNELSKKLPAVVTTPEKHFSFLTFYNNHNPYKWGGATEGISKNVGDDEDFTEIRQTKNRYTNSFVASNLNFDRLIKLIGTLPGHQNAVVILFSDHGEMLYEKYREAGHGGILFREKIQTVLAFQFPERPDLRSKKDSTSITSMSDIFPTLFDYMGVTPQLSSHWVTGHSLISNPRTSTLAVRSNKDDPTREMVLINQTQKAWIEVEEDDFYHSKSFRLIKVTDLDDRTIENFCKNKNEEECKQQLIALFPDALKELYPGLTTTLGAGLTSSKPTRNISSVKPKKPGSHK